MHQAGHAMAAVVLDLGLKSVDLKRREYENGRLAVGFAAVRGVRAEETVGKGEEVVFPYLIQRLAGGYAESLVHGALQHNDCLEEDFDEI
jgi:hypothetical protein